MAKKKKPPDPYEKRLTLATILLTLLTAIVNLVTALVRLLEK